MNWVTVWGFGADIRTAGDTLFVREKGKSTADRYPLNEVSHLIIAGDNILHTSVIEKCQEKKIPVSFFDIRGNPAGCLFGENPRLSAAQDAVSAHAYAKSVIESSLGARMRYLHELAEQHGEFYRKGEVEILMQARSELEYLITLPELARVYTLTKDMYYEILSRAVPRETGYKRRTEDVFADPVNTLLSIGYAALYATVNAACRGAGLDTKKSGFFKKYVPCKGEPCVCEVMEPARTPMVDRVVIQMAEEGLLSDATRSGKRWIFPEKTRAVFSARLKESVDCFCIEENVKAYAKAVEAGRAPEFHYPA